MKKAIFLLFAIAITTLCQSQNFNKVYRASYLKYIDGKWVNDVDKYPEDVFIILNDSEIKITNKNESKYITYGEKKNTKYETYDCNSWSAYDKNGKDCEFIMKYFYKEKVYVMMFMYYSDSIGFEYEIVADK
jgi:hypothetical protein